MKRSAFYVMIFIGFISCSSGGDDASPDLTNPKNGGSGTVEWLIPIAEVKDGGPGKDGIPSIDNPKFVSASQANFLIDDDLLVGIVVGNTARAYPYGIMNWHEIVNDEINGEVITINYCPLTGTAFGWKSEAKGTRSTFGVSGLLYNANLILYDRNTDSFWSQLRLECVNGELIRDKPTLFTVIETNWKTWKTLYPNTEVLSQQTGFSRNYSVSPYGDYAVNNERFIFNPSIFNSALPNKERVYAIIENNKSKVYQFVKFNGGQAIKETFEGKNFLVVGDQNVIHAYQLTGEYLNLNFEYAFNTSTGVLFTDNEGNKWNAFGEAIEGPRLGEKLIGARSVVSYWFAIAVFYPNPLIY